MLSTSLVFALRFAVVVLAAAQTGSSGCSDLSDYLAPLATVLAVGIGYALSSWTHYRSRRREVAEKARESRQSATVAFLASVDGILTKISFGRQQLRKLRSESDTTEGAIRSAVNARIFSLLENLSNGVSDGFSTARVEAIKLRVVGARSGTIEAANNLIELLRAFVDSVEQMSRPEPRDDELDAIERVLKQPTALFEEIISSVQKED